MSAKPDVETDEPPIPAAPMASRIKDRGQKSALASKISESPQTITNWIKRGTIPARKLRKICRALGIQVSTYRREAGLPVDEGAIQGKLDTAPLVRDFEALPPALRDFVATQAHDLRQMVESIRPDLRPLISAPPKDRARYKEWEDGIKALVALTLKR